MRASRIAFALGASLLLASVWTSAQHGVPQTKTTASEVQVKGDPLKGQAIFLGKGGCLSCHRVADEGSRLGPNLSGIATARSVEELRSALLDPEPDVAPRDQLYRVMTSDGQTITGRSSTRMTSACKYWILMNSCVGS